MCIWIILRFYHTLLSRSVFGASALNHFHFLNTRLHEYEVKLYMKSFLNTRVYTRLNLIWKVSWTQGYIRAKTLREKFPEHKVIYEVKLCMKSITWTKVFTYILQYTTIICEEICTGFALLFWLSPPRLLSTKYLKKNQHIWN